MPRAAVQPAGFIPDMLLKGQIVVGRELASEHSVGVLPEQQCSMQRAAAAAAAGFTVWCQHMHAFATGADCRSRSAPTPTSPALVLLHKVCNVIHLSRHHDPAIILVVVLSNLLQSLQGRCSLA